MEGSILSSSEAEKKKAQSFSEFQDRIENGEDFTLEELRNGLNDSVITQAEYYELGTLLASHLEGRIKTLEEKMGVDSLTGLLDRQRFLPKLEELTNELNIEEKVWHEERKLPLQFLMVVALDMNNLKTLNDTFHHDVGDRAIIALTQELKRTVRDTDFLFRFVRGDEFKIILPIYEKGVEGEKVAEMLLKRIDEAVNYSSLSISIETEEGKINFAISASLGHAVLRKGERKTGTEFALEAEVIERADKAEEKRKRERATAIFKKEGY